MATSIGKLAATVSVDSTGLAGGLKAAADKFSAFAGGVSSKMQAVAGALKSIPLVGQAFAALPVSGAGFLAWVKDGMREVAEITKAANRFGISTERMSALALAAGGNIQDLEGGLFHLQARLGEVTAGNKEAALGFQRLGLDGAELAKLPLDQVLEVIGKRLAELPNATERTSAAMQIFSRRGMEVTGLLNKLATGGGLAAFEAKAKAVGLSFSQIEGVRVMAAVKAMKEMDLVLGGIKRQLAIELGPVLGVVVREFTDLASRHGGFKNLISAGVDLVVQGMIALTHVMDVVIVKFQELYDQAKEFGQLGKDIRDVPGKIVKRSTLPGWIYSLYQYLSGPEEVLDAMPGSGGGDTGAFAGARKTLQALLDKVTGMLDATPPAGPNLAETGRAADVAQLEESLRQSIATHKLSAAEIKRYELAQRGATAADLSRVDALVRQSKAKELADSLKSPMEAFNEQVDKLDEAFASGLSTDKFLAGILRAKEALEAAVGAAQDKGPSAALEGSREAYSAIARFNDAGATGNVQVDIRELLRRADEQRQEQIRQGQAILDQLRNVTVS